MRSHLCLLSVCLVVLPANARRVPDSGVYAIWYGRHGENLLDLPFVTGGQAVTQWQTVEPEPGRYDFTSLDRQLAPLQERGYKATVQVNGNRKPDFLYERVPYYPEKLSVQIKDEQGSLMFWHPAHAKAYEQLIRALGQYLETSPYRDAVLGVRLNFNAFGTEHSHLKSGEARQAANWIVPPGGEPGTDWSVETVREYQDRVFEAHLEHIAPHVRVFVRNALSEETLERHRQAFETGRLSWFHTSSEAEPRAGAEWRYRRFYEYCRSGKTTAYAEPWASAWGDHGGKTDDRACSPPQWNYWRLLLDLHNGVSHIAGYSADLRVAADGTYRYNRKQSHDDKTAGTNYRDEFAAAFRFAAEYAGFHQAPGHAPGAWCAFRENEVVREANGRPPEKRKLEFYTGDYNFLMSRRPDRTEPLGVTGPDAQRFGGWARRLPDGETVTLDLNPDFADSLQGQPATVALVYLDTPDAGSTQILCGNSRGQVPRGKTDRWQRFELPVPAVTGRTVILTCRERPVTLHMVEVRRQPRP